MRTPALSLRFAPDLQEAVVLAEIERRRGGEARWHDDYRKAADQVYALHAHPSARRAAIHQLHDRLFRELGFDRPIAEALDRLRLQLAALVARAWGPEEEEADLSTDGRTLGLRLMPNRFGSADLFRILWHELGHVIDMLDEAFGYRGIGSGFPVAVPRLTRDRFSLMWDCVIDGRTARGGAEPLTTRQDRLAVFRYLYREFPPDAAEAAVGVLWDGARPTYAELVAFARDPLALATWCGLPGSAGPASAQSAGWAVPVPGAPCPLCGFPTHAWERTIPESAAARIAADFPGWSPARGACERCVEGYAVSALV